MKLIGLEEHRCPRELFEKEGTPGYESIMSVKNLFDTRQYEAACRRVSYIGEGRIRMMDAVGLSMTDRTILSGIHAYYEPEELTYRCHKKSHNFQNIWAVQSGLPIFKTREMYKLGFIRVLSIYFLKQIEYNG